MAMLKNVPCFLQVLNWLLVGIEAAGVVFGLVSMTAAIKAVATNNKPHWMKSVAMSAFAGVGLVVGSVVLFFSYIDGASFPAWFLCVVSSICLILGWKNPRSYVAYPLLLAWPLWFTFWIMWSDLHASQLFR